MSYWIYLKLPPCSHCKRGDDCVFDSNITRNLSPIVNILFDESYLPKGDPDQKTDFSGRFSPSGFSPRAGGTSLLPFSVSSQPPTLPLR